MASPNASEDDYVPIDPAEPLKGIVVCCTSIPPEQRSSLAQKVAELGGIHKYDLTPDVTHLVVGDYNTPKYRHVARERSDILAMDAAWIEALAELWKKDDEINFRKLEKEYQLKPLEKRGILPASQGELAKRDSLLVCLTGFGDQREDIAHRITANGGRYTGDLTRKCTHLIVNRPEGKKFAAAISWGIYAVALAWLDQTIARGMILEESKFDPTLPAEEQGKGAWVKKDPKRASMGKRSRSLALNNVEEGPRKLRKTASMKLNSQRDNIWGDILGRSTSREYSFAQQEQPAHKAPEPQAPIPEKRGVFANCYFFIHGFDQQRTGILEQTIFNLNGSICGSLEQAASGSFAKEAAHRFLLVPQTSHPDTHPEAHYDNLHIVTEYYIEKCMHNKQFFDPSEQVLGRPFPLFPIAGFSDLTICSSGFTGIELSQVARSVAQLGAKFSEGFHTSTSVLLCRALKTVRKDKLRMALKCGIPVVPAEWLWECISTGFNVPLKDFIYPELQDLYQAKPGAAHETKRKESTDSNKRAPSEPRMKTSDAPVLKPTLKPGVDTTTFDDSSKKSRQGNQGTRQDSTVSADFATARETLGESFNPEADAPLTEVCPTKLNKSPSPTRHATILSRSKSDPTHQMMAPKEPQAQPAVQPPPASLPHPLAETITNPLKQTTHQPHHRQPQPPPEIRRKAAAAEEAKKQAKAAERQALSSKLTSLIDSTTPDTQASNLAHPAPRQRRRQIFGRAISNASNASSATSADYVATKPAPEDGFFAGFDEEPEKEVAPPGTQLGYLDPEAQEVKAALMNRMMGGSAEVKPPSSSKVVGVVGGRSLRKR